MATSVSAPVTRWTGTPNENVDITSSAFTPADNSLLVVCVSADQDESSTANQTVSVSGGGWTWTERIKRNGANQSNHGAAYIWTAPVTTGASMSVNVRFTAKYTSTARLSAQVYVVTGQNATPIGTTGSGSHDADPAGNFSLFTATGAGRAFWCTTDWNATDSGTPDIGTADTGDSFFYSGAVTVGSFYTSGHTSGTVNGNVDYGGTPAANWVALEILEAEGGGGGSGWRNAFAVNANQSIG